MTEELITTVVEAIVALVASLEGQPTQAQIEATVRAAMVKASDLSMQTEFAGQAP